jgi:LPXTG-motif cell wall-anchored protein
VTCDLTVNRDVVHPGDTFTATGTIKGADTATPVSWTFRWNGVSKHRTGASAQATFTAPHVSHTRTIRLAGRSHYAVNGEARTCVHHLDIKVVSAEVSAPSSGGLPSTGGPAFWILVAAVALLLAGSGTLIASRRRTH